MNLFYYEEQSTHTHTHTHTPQGTTEKVASVSEREGGRSPTLFWPEQCREWVSPYSPGAVARAIEPAPAGCYCPAGAVARAIEREAHPVSSTPDACAWQCRC